MAETYYLCIDETGEFEYHLQNSMSSVGGYLCTEAVWKTLFDDFNNFRNALAHRYPELQRFKNNASLHEGVMTREFNGRLFMTEIQPFFAKADLTVVMTKGRVPLSIHPQQAYSGSLVALIAGVIKSDEINENCNELVVRISRRNPLLTNRQRENKNDYYKTMCNDIIKIFTDSGLIERLKLSLSTGYAIEDKDLILADLILGIARKKSNDRFTRTVINVGEHYQVILGQNMPSLINELINQESYEEAFSILTSNLPYDDTDEFFFLTINRLVKEILFYVDGEIIIKHALQVMGDYLLAERNSGLDSMNVLQKIMGIVLQEVNDSDYYSLKFMAHKYAIHACAHLGVAKSGRVHIDSIDTLLSKHGPEIFPRSLERFMEWIEVLLVAVQDLYFNDLEFEKVEMKLSQDYELYEKFAKNFQDHRFESNDDLLARLAGTVGQATAFNGCMNSDKVASENAFEEAQVYLEEDLNNLQPSNFFYKQGLSFMLTLRCWQENIQEAEVVITKILDTSADSEAVIEILSNPDEGFRILDWLRYWGLRHHVDGTLPKKQLLDAVQNNPALENQYPWNLIRKWFAYQLAAVDRKEEAILILNTSLSALTGESPLNTLMLLSSKGFRNYIKGHNPGSDRVKRKLDDQAEEHLGTKKLMEARFEQWNNSATLWEAAMFLPYYYS